MQLLFHLNILYDILPIGCNWCTCFCMFCTSKTVLIVTPYIAQFEYQLKWMQLYPSRIFAFVIRFVFTNCNTAEIYCTCLSKFEREKPLNIYRNKRNSKHIHESEWQHYRKIALGLTNEKSSDINNVTNSQSQWKISKTSVTLHMKCN